MSILSNNILQQLLLEHMDIYTLKCQSDQIKSICDNLYDDYMHRLTIINQQLLQFEQQIKLLLQIVIEQQLIDLVWLNRQWLKLQHLRVEQQNLLVILQHLIEHKLIYQQINKQINVHKQLKMIKKQ